MIGGRYSLVSMIGAGGMGAVYLAVDAKLGRRVAVKVVPADADGLTLRRFEREARIMAGIKGGRIVQVHDFGVDEAIGVSFHVMDAILLDHAKADAIRARVLGRRATPRPKEDDGEFVSLTLENVLAGNVALDERTAALLAVDILDSIHAIHSNDPEVIHRDLKPSNLIFSENGDLLLSDFGIAKYNHAEAERISTLTMTGSAPGTPTYASPEQRAGAELTAATDYYSFGLVTYRMLTGGLPGTATSELPSDVKGRVSRKWNALLSGLLEREPAKRLVDYAVTKGRLLAIIRSLDASRKLKKSLTATAKAMAVVALSVALVFAGIGIYHASEKQASAEEWNSNAPAKDFDPFEGEPADWVPANKDEHTDLVNVNGVLRPYFMDDGPTIMSIADVLHDKNVLRERVEASNLTIDLLRECAVEQTNNAVMPTAGGGALVIGKGQVFDYLSCPKESLPNEIILDGGTLLFAIPFSRLESVIEKAVEEKNRRVWCWRNRKWLPSENGPPEPLTFDEVYEWINQGNTKDEACHIPIKVKPGHSTIKRSNICARRIDIRGPISAEDTGIQRIPVATADGIKFMTIPGVDAGGTATLLLYSSPAEYMRIDADMLSPAIALDKRSLGVIWNWRTDVCEKKLVETD